MADLSGHRAASSLKVPGRPGPVREARVFQASASRSHCARQRSRLGTPYLEAMLRQFEHEDDLLAADGKTGVDTAWLREQLDMPSDLAG